VKKAIFSCIVAWMFLQSSSRAQSGPDSPRLRANNEIPSTLVAALPSLSRTGGEPYRSAPVQKFVCNTGYKQKECDDEMAVLRKALANYRVSDLGEWTWVLVRSENWKVILLARGLDPGVPALTVPDLRTTFFEEALVAGPSGRVSELMDIWHLSRNGLLDLAIRHELGHALCNDANERKADRIARLLEQRKPVSCEAKTEAKQKSGYHTSLN
jgi:hypothetical protein